MTSRHDDDTTPRIERTSVLALPADELATDDLRRHLVSLAGVRAPTLAPLLRCASVPGGVALTHLVPADAVSMASLSSAGPLRSGQVLGVGVAVLEALVALHALDLVHAGVGPESVLVGPDGSVVLAGSGLGWARTCALDVEPAPAHDIEAVGALVRDLLGPGSAPAPLVRSEERRVGKEC